MLTNSFVLGATSKEYLTAVIFYFTRCSLSSINVLLKKVAWGPLIGIMIKREEQIASEIDDAEKSRTESNRLLEEQKALLKEARIRSSSDDREFKRTWRNSA